MLDERLKGNRCCATYQVRMNDTQDSARRQQLNTTQYMSHGVSCAGSEVLRAL